MRKTAFPLFVIAAAILIASTNRTANIVKAAIVTITFDEYAIGTHINAQYSPLGVIFTGSNNGPFITTDGANPTSPVLSGDPLFQGSITAVFVTPYDPARPALARNVSFDAGYFDSTGSTTVSWYDSNNNLLGSQTNSQIGIERFSIPNNIGVFSIAITSNEPAGYAIDNLSFEIVPQFVEITQAEISSNHIEVLLNSIGASGRFVLTLIGDSNFTLFDNTLSGSGTPYQFNFNLNSLPTGQFSQLRADWTVNGTTSRSTKNVSFRVLGTYRHSQYNTPAEASCGGNPAKAFIIETPCVFNANTLLNKFMDKVNLNGSGLSIHFGTVKPETFCTKDSKHPPPGSKNSSFRETAITPQCGGQGLSDSTVARAPNHPYLLCGDQVMLVNSSGGIKAVKTVTDLCPGCAVKQLDNYTTDTACSGIPDLGKFVTIRLR